jgi:hypothetical protein
MEALTTAYGEETGPIMSKTRPTTFRFSSITEVPNLGGLSIFTTMLCDGVTLITFPNLCNTHSPLRKQHRQRSSPYKVFYKTRYRRGDQ